MRVFKINEVVVCAHDFVGYNEYVTDFPTKGESYHIRKILYPRYKGDAVSILLKEIKNKNYNNVNDDDQYEVGFNLKFRSGKPYYRDMPRCRLILDAWHYS